jgi:hypothetical protein
MRLHAGLLKTFWAKAVSTAAHLINKGPSLPLGHKLPKEVWSENEVNLSHLKVFGCASYVYSNARSKLDVKSIKCFFIGYEDEAFGYRFWDDKNRKIIRSWKVSFNECDVYKDGSSTKPGVTEKKPKESECVNLDSSFEDEVQKNDQQDEESVDLHVERGTPTTVVRRSTRISRPR